MKKPAEWNWNPIQLQPRLTQKPKMSWLSFSKRKNDERAALGRRSEELACAYLKREGYEIEARNVRYKVGELDIVAKENSALCFIEVRSKTSSEFGTALESITLPKRRRFIKAVTWYLNSRRPAWQGDVRFDVVAIDIDAQGEPKLKLMRGAFDTSC